MPKKDSILNVTLLVFGLCLSLELGSYILLSQFAERFRVRERVLRVSTEEELRVLEQAFDPELGWLTKFTTIYGQRPGGDEAAAAHLDALQGTIALFGDSFVFGDGLGDGETIAARLSQSMTVPVLNFGQPGFGTDQAVLYFERKAPDLKVANVVLGLTAESLNRIINSYRPCYSVATRFRFPKPRFRIIDHNLKLMANPVATLQAFQAWEERVVSGESVPDDYWCQSAIGPSASFPYSLGVLSKKFRHVLMSNPSRVAEDVWADAGNRGLLTAILDRYRKGAEHFGMRPVLMLLDATHARNQAEEFFKLHCSNNQVHCINAYRCLVDNPDANGRSITRLPDGHFDAHSTLRVAQCMTKYMAREALLK